MKYENKSRIILFLIILISAVFRYAVLDDPNGLWYDELVSYNEASYSNIPFLISYTLKTDVHLPLYPLILHYWAELISFTDFALREFSAVCGILTVIVAYFIGKELKSKQTGLICASVFAVNSFLIFYSQEVRVYAFLMLFASLNVLFLTKIKNNYKKTWNYVALILCSLTILYSSIFGIMLAGFQFLSFIIYLLLNKDDNNKKIMKNFLLANFITLIFISPLLLYLYNNHEFYFTQINGYYCDWSSLFIIVQDWFTPVLVGLFNNPQHYMHTIVSNITIYTVIFIFVPIILSLYFVYNAIKKDKFSWVLLGTSLCFLLVEVIAFRFTDFKILPRYTALVFPNMLILVGYGLGLIDFKKYTKYVLLAIFLGVSLFYLIFSDNAAFRIMRYGYRPVGNILNSLNLKDNDFIVVWNRTEILNRYVNKDLNVLSLLRHFAYSSEVILENENYLRTIPLKERKKFLREYFSDEDTPRNTEYLMDIIYNKMRPGQKFIIKTKKDFDKYTKESFTNLVNNNQSYNSMTFNNLLTIKSLTDLKEECYEKFRLVKKIKKNQFVIIVFEKV